jgi:hypothetical protein
MATNSFDQLDKYMQFIIPDCNSRILGQQNIHFNILDVIAYWEDPRAKAEWGDFTMKMVVNRNDKPIGPWIAILVSNINMGQNFPASLYFWGQAPGINTIVSRYQWWKLYVISAIRINIRNRMSGKTGISFIPNAATVGTLTREPLINLQSRQRFLGGAGNSTKQVKAK